MLALSDLQRSIRDMTLGFHHDAKRRAREADAYALAEREQQFQYEFVGQAGALPVEKDIDVAFSLVFIGDAGNQRDSTLDRPQFKVGFEEDYGPPGLIPYAKIVAWNRDEDLHYMGAKVRVGCHCPAVAIEGVLVNQGRFKFAVHLTFQGFGAQFDPEGEFDAGGSLDFADWSGVSG